MTWLEPMSDKPDQRSALEWLVIGILAGIALVGIYFLLSTPASGQDAGPIQVSFTRDTVYPNDPDRCFVCMWSRGDPQDPNSIGLIRRGDTGDLDTVTLRAADGTLHKTQRYHLRERTEYEGWHWKSFQVPPVAPGQYTVMVGGRDRGVITVAQGPLLKVIKLSPGERLISLTAKTNEQVRGFGCTITGNLTVQPGASVVGLRIDGNVTGNFDNVVFDSCTFRRGQVGPMQANDRSVLFRDCVFENCTAFNLSSGLLLRCKFVGRTARGGHNFCNEWASRLAVIDCEWDNTDRGIIARPRWGDNSDNLYAGLWFSRIATTPNGDELLCVEGQGKPEIGFHRNLIFCVRSTACNGPLLLYSSKASYNLFNNVRCPIDVTGMDEQIGNIVQDSECEYVRVNWPRQSKANGTQLLNITSVGFTPRPRNQPTGDPVWWHDSKFTAVFQDSSPAPTTRGVGLTARGQAAGFARVLGVQE